MGADSVWVDQCADELDNDNDGLVDLPSGCERMRRTTMNRTRSYCRSAVWHDNDDDGLIDDARGCENSNGDNEFDDPITTQCDDMVDNDGDGDIDLEDRAAPIAEIMTSQTKRLSLNVVMASITTTTAMSISPTGLRI